ncbi:hypothetical protein KAZ92_01860 [Candidatus Gracilibacteria bacterium]|nr:hypothetical protein [Candidatus Gracilibacteria bacterium]
MISYSFLSNLISYFHGADPETLSDRDLFETAQRIGAVALKGRRAFIGLLPLVEKRRAYEGRTFYSIYDFAAKVGGVSRDVVVEVLRIDIQLQDMPLVRKLLYGGTVSWSKIRMVTAWLTPENQQIWIDKLENLSNRALEVYLRDYRKQLSGDRMIEIFPEHSYSLEQLILTTGSYGLKSSNIPNNTKNEAENFGAEISEHKINIGESQEIATETMLKVGPGEQIHSERSKLSELSDHRETFTFSMNAEIAARLRLFRQRLEKDRRELVTWEEVMLEFLKMIESETRHDEKKKSEKSANQAQVASVSTLIPIPTPAATSVVLTSTATPATRYIPAAARHQIAAQYSGLCAFRDCAQPATTLHHTKRFALTKHLPRSEAHDPNFIKPLCTPHERIIHNTLVENEEVDPKSWKLLATPAKLEASVKPDSASGKAAVRAIDQRVMSYRKPI